jgi:hypothetical protein
MELACSAVATPNNNPRLPFGSYQTTPTTHPDPTKTQSYNRFSYVQNNTF